MELEIRKKEERKNNPEMEKDKKESGCREMKLKKKNCTVGRSK